MAYCRSCGEKINDNAFVCVHCGVKVLEEKPSSSVNDNSVTLGIIGLCFFWIPIVTWIVSGIGMGSASKNGNSKGKTLNLIALIVTSTYFLIFFIIGLTG